MHNQGSVQDLTASAQPGSVEQELADLAPLASCPTACDLPVAFP